MANLTGNGAPTKHTVGAIGDIYTDSTSGKQWECTGMFGFDANKDGPGYSEYEWDEDEGSSGNGVTISNIAAVGQMLMVEEVDNAGKPTKWQTVDRTHYVKETEVTVYDGVVHLPTSKIKMLSETLFNIEKGKTYKVEWNGALYECVGYRATTNGVTYCWLGNTILSSLLGSSGVLYNREDTGEPFLFEWGIDPTTDAFGMGFVHGDAKDADIAVIITNAVEEIVPLPPEYLPDGVPYLIGDGTVDILPETTLTSESGGYLTSPPSYTPKDGDTCTVTWNGVEYTTPAVLMEDEGASAIVLGDIYTISGGELGTVSTGEPFAILFFTTPIADEEVTCYGVIYPLTDDTEFTFSISKGSGSIRKLPNECLDLEWIPKEEIREDSIFPATLIDTNGSTNTMGNMRIVTIDCDRDTLLAYEELAVVCNGTNFHLTKQPLSETAGLYMIDGYTQADLNNWVPFFLSYNQYEVSFGAVAEAYSVKIFGITKKLKAIPEKFLPESVTALLGSAVTEDEVKTLINTALGVIENGSY